MTRGWFGENHEVDPPCVIRVGALFSGYAGIEIALAQVASEHPGVEVELVWYCEVDPAASKIMAHHYPNAINLGDVTKVDWHEVRRIYGPIDVIGGGSPCQDLSHAGKRAGMKAGTRSGLWASMCDAIDIIRPNLVIWENVRGALSAEADSAVEPCPICVGDGGRVTLRALGRVLGDLSELGYDARWYGLRAADVGAAHGRFRIFLFATPGDTSGHNLWNVSLAVGSGQGRAQQPTGSADGPIAHVPGQLTLLPTPTTVEGTGPGSHGTGGDNLRTVVDQLPPTPQAADGNGGGRRSSPGHATTLPGEVLDRLLPTPTATDALGSRNSTAWRSGGQEGVHIGDTLTDVAWKYGGHSDPRMPANEPMQDWREYEAAIRRQEHILGRPAPLPTEPGAKGQPRLSPRFVEWLMNLPDGWVTDVPGISRNDMLKALGNGVVPAQCAAALRAFLSDISEEARSA